MKTITALAAFAAFLAATPALAGDAKETRETRRGDPQVASKFESRRPTTVERWRGAPYTRSGSYNDALIRAEALDKTLPVVTTTPNLATTPGF